MIKIEEIESFSLECPNSLCDSFILEGTPTQTRVAQGGSWQDDGDAISGLWGRLSEEQKNDKGWDTELLVGRCNHCGEQYIVIEAKFVDAQPDENWQYIYFHGNGNSGQELNRVASYSGKGNNRKNVPKSWLLQSFNSPIGRVHVHVFGPYSPVSKHFQLSNRESSLPDWVRACNLLLFLWADMKDLAAKEKSFVHKEIPPVKTLEFSGWIPKHLLTRAMELDSEREE